MDRTVKKGDVFKHFKGMEVEILELAKDSETLDEMVVYKHLGTDEVWVRPLTMFLSKVDKNKYPDIKQEYRFEKIK
jgi:hypothetical protein